MPVARQLKVVSPRSAQWKLTGNQGKGLLLLAQTSTHGCMRATWVELVYSTRKVR